MGAVVVFTEESRESNGALAVGAEVELFPLLTAEVADGEIDLAIIECGADADAGLHLLRKIKHDRPSVPVIFITAVGSYDVLTRAFKEGARDYFREPVDPNELEAMVKMLLNFKRGGAAISSPGDDATGAEPDTPLVGGLPEGILQAVHYIESNLSGGIALDILARKACMSKFHFCRLFKRYLGMSSRRFIAVRRIEKAKQFLKAECTIAVAALASGFNDLSDFCRQFKKYSGKTPSEYRRSCRNEKDPAK